MVISYNTSFQKALKQINFQNEKHEFIIHNSKNHNVNPNCEQLLTRYSNALWSITEITNEKYSHLLDKPFNLYNWIKHQPRDELAYFLSETGNNCLNHAPFMAPHKFILYLGELGFIIKIEHEGPGFNAKKIDENKTYKNEGAAFDFYRNCQNKIFFNDSKNATAVFMLHLTK